MHVNKRDAKPRLSSTLLKLKIHQLIAKLCKILKLTCSGVIDQYDDSGELREASNSHDEAVVLSVQ